MMSGLDNVIAAAGSRSAAAQNAWDAKHLPVKFDGKVYWLSVEVPAGISQVLAHLPQEREREEQRLHQIKTRLSDEELEAFDLLVTASGLPQGEYIRGMVLNGCVEVTQTSLVDARALETLMMISMDLGRLAGMIRRTVIVNKEFAVLTPAEKDQLEEQLRQLRRLQSGIQSLAEEIHGNLQT